VKNPPSLSGKDVREGLAAVISVKVPDPQFEGQTKTKLGNSEVRGIVESVINEELATYLEENPTMAKAIMEKSIRAAQVRAAALISEQTGIPAAGFCVECFEDYLRLLKVCTSILHTPERYEAYGENMRLDSIAFQEFYKSFEEATQNSDKPYFAFHVTYQGHGPYSAETREWGDGTNFYNENLSQADNYILDNYLGSLKDTGWQIDWFINQIKASEEPTVVLMFGDHKPWLGDGNSVYNALGVNLDVSTEEGFRNYYGTEYVIVANDKAKEVLGFDFTGKGPTTSPCMLMNVLYDYLDIRGDSFMRYTRDVRQYLPAFNLVGAYDKDGNFYTIGNMPENLASVYNEYMRVSYYRSKNLQKD
jgi:hypothetical protein